MSDIWNNENLIRVLRGGGIAVMPTDTIYGVVGRAESPETVERLYTVRKRPPEIPFIILIGDIGELEKFSIYITDEQQKILNNYWYSDVEEDSPRPTSIVLDCPLLKFKYLHRGKDTLAFRLPKNESLRNLLKETGPLIAPSANISGQPNSKTIEEAKNYFGDLVDSYVDAGVLEGKASQIIRLFNDGTVSIIRK